MRVQYNEYDPLKKDLVITITCEEAIRRQKLSGQQVGYEYQSNEQALQDFITANWAWEIEDK